MPSVVPLALSALLLSVWHADRSFCRLMTDFGVCTPVCLITNLSRLLVFIEKSNIQCVHTYVGGGGGTGGPACVRARACVWRGVRARV